MINLVLVNPNNRIPAPFAAIEPPLWLGLIAGYRLAQGDNVAIVDAEAEELTVKQTVKRVEELHPKQTIIVVMGANPSVSSTPKWPVTEELLEHLDAKVTGIHPIAVNHPRAIAHPFQGCPIIPWYLFCPMDKYRAHNWHCLADLESRKSYAILYTSLNCPYNCYYCNVHTLYGDHNLRLSPMEDVTGELDFFAEMGIRNIKIWDELFCLNEKRVVAICDHIISAGYHFNIWAYARLDTVTPKMLSKMKAAGINWLAYGFESVKDKKFISRAEDVIRMTKEAGIAIIANFMFGLPGTTREDDRASVNFAKKQLFEFVNFYDAKPYPGSQWYEDTKPDIKPVEFDQYADISAFRDCAFVDYFTNPSYLRMIQAKWGNQAIDQIKGMMQCRLSPVR